MRPRAPAYQMGAVPKDIDPPAHEGYWHGPAGAQIPQLKARIRELELCVAMLESALIADRSTRGDKDDALDRAREVMGPRMNGGGR